VPGMIKRGKLPATWEDVPAQIRLQLEDEMTVAGGREAANESKLRPIASLCSGHGFDGDGKPMAVHEQTEFRRLRQDEPVQRDQLMEGQQAELAAAEAIAALAGQVKALRGSNYAGVLKTGGLRLWGLWNFVGWKVDGIEVRESLIRPGM